MIWAVAITTFIAFIISTRPIEWICTVSAIFSIIVFTSKQFVVCWLRSWNDKKFTFALIFLFYLIKEELRFNHVFREVAKQMIVEINILRDYLKTQIW